VIPEIDYYIYRSCVQIFSYLLMLIVVVLLSKKKNRLLYNYTKLVKNFCYAYIDSHRKGNPFFFK